MKESRIRTKPIIGVSLRKMLFFVKITCVVWCCSFMSASANVLSQRTLITMDMQNVSLEKVLKELSLQAQCDFLYNDNLIKAKGDVSLVVKNKSLEQVLDVLLPKLGLDYLVDDNVIIIRAKEVGKDEKKEIRIVGKVIDEKKLPLPGVTVIVKGTQLGTATDAQGKYALRLPEMKNVILVFSFMGMETQEVKYTGKDTINVTMKEDVQKINEVVVTGYANIRKESFTGNATTVTKEQLMKTNNKNVIAALQHFDPSFRIKENTIWGSDPNALPEFNIRGESSIAMRKGLDVEKAKQTQRSNLRDNPNLPIFILDGFEVSVQKIYDMDMNRIESFTILKDAAATAMYGSRAANGVVVVTTIAPKPGEMRITYNFAGGVELPDLSDYNLCNAAEKLEVERLSGVYTASTPDMQVDRDRDYNKKMQDILRGVDTDWMALPLRNVFNHTHSLNVQGGVESIRYSVDLNYDSNNGAMKGSHRTRAGAGLTLDYRSKKWLQILNQFSYSTTRSEDSPYGNFSTYVNMLPYLPIYDDNGDLLKTIQVGSGTSYVANPLWKVKNLKSYSGKGEVHDFTNNLSVNLFLTDGLQFKGQFSITKSNSKTESFVDPNDPSEASTDKKEQGRLSRMTEDGYSWNLNAMFYYNKALQKHFVNATLGVNANESKSETSETTWKGFQLGSMNKPGFAAGQPNKTDVVSSASRLFGILASVNYSYNDVYLFDASFRLDGSSQYGADKRFAPFWSIGGGINIHNYAWLKDHWFINTLKIRATYGSTGKVNFPSYTAVTTYKTDTDKWYYTGPSTSLIYLGNPKLTWETTKKIDAGISIGLLQDKFYIDFTYYRNETEDLIDKIAIRNSSGFSEYYTNTGSVLNEGFEINANAVIYEDRDWMVRVNANLGSNKNKITEIGKEMEEYNKKLKENYDAEYAEYPELATTPLIMYYEGASTSAIYAVRSAGIDPANGKEKFIKKNGTSTYTWAAEDQVVVGDNNPDAQGAFGLSVSFKGFYLNASFLYQWGAQTYNSTLLNKVENADIENSNVDKRVLTQRWRKAGDIVPYYDLKNNRVTKPTSRFVQDYNYLDFSSLSCGYDFKKELIQKIRLASLGLRFNANSLCRWSSVKEERGTSYPYAKNYSFTLSVGF